MSISLPDLSDVGTCMCGHFDHGCDACRETAKRMAEYNRKNFDAMTPRQCAESFQAEIPIAMSALHDKHAVAVKRYVAAMVKNSRLAWREDFR